MIVATTPTPEPTILFADDFGNPTSGQLQKSSPMPGYYAVGYVDGEYLIKKLVPGWAQSPGVPLPGRYRDVIVRVNARLVGETENRYLVVACRDQGVSDSNYRLTVAPSDGSLSLARWDRGRETRLVERQTSSAIKTGNETNHLEMVCVGSKIAAIVNGTQVAAVTDATYQEGGVLLLVSHAARSPSIVEGRFDNLALLRP
jgi:hypothetical protein